MAKTAVAFPRHLIIYAPVTSKYLQSAVKHLMGITNELVPSSFHLTYEAIRKQYNLLKGDIDNGSAYWEIRFGSLYIVPTAETTLNKYPHRYIHHANDIYSINLKHIITVMNLKK